MKIQNKKSTKLKKTMAILGAIVLLGGASYGAYYLWFDEDNGSNTSEPSNDDETTEPREEPDGQSGSGQEPTDIDDTEGQDAEEENNEGVTSDSGVITLNMPADGGLLANGSTISGQSSTEKVSYRIIDSSRGMIAQGELNVADGRFSARINGISPYSDSGVLQVFSIDPDTFREDNLVQIDIRLE